MTDGIRRSADPGSSDDARGAGEAALHPARQTELADTAARALRRRASLHSWWDEPRERGDLAYPGPLGWIGTLTRLSHGLTSDCPMSD